MGLTSIFHGSFGLLSGAVVLMKRDFHVVFILFYGMPSGKLKNYEPSINGP